MAKNKHFFIKDSIVQLLSTGYVGAISLAITIFLARTLGVKEFGRYQYALTIGSFYALLQDAGFRTLIFREKGAESPEISAYIKRFFPPQTTSDQLLTNLSLIHLIIITLIGITITLLLPQSLLFSLAIIYYALFVASTWISAYLKGKGLFIPEAIWQATFRTTTAISIVLFIITTNYQPLTTKQIITTNYQPLTTKQIITTNYQPLTTNQLPTTNYQPLTTYRLLSSENIFLATITGAVIAFVFFLLKSKFSIKKIKTLKLPTTNHQPLTTNHQLPTILYHLLSIYRFSLPFLVIDFFTLIYFRSDLIIVGYLAGYKEAGLYAAAYRLIEGVILMATPIMHILFQRLRLVWTEKVKFQRLLHKALVSAVFASFVLLGLGWGFTKTIVRIIYGVNFIKAEILLKYLLVALFFILPNYLLTQATIALNKERFYAWTTVILACVNVGLNFWLVPWLGAKGAAISTVITEGLLFGIMGIGVGRWLVVSS